MRATLIGATGLLGKALMRAWSAGPVTGLGSRDVDIREERQVAATLDRTRPDWIILAAAYTDVDGCESNSKLAFDVNARGPANVARAARQAGSRLLHLSTDYVFDGAKSTPYETGDPLAPLSVYGRSKAEGEAAVAAILPESCIVRTSWVFGIGRANFPEAILQRAAVSGEMDVVDDQTSCATYTVDLAQAIQELVQKSATGIVHATNAGQCSRFELAREVVAQAGLPTVVRPVSSAKFPRPAARPKYSVLSPRSLEGYGVPMPSWQNALGRYLEERRAMQPASGGKG